MRVPRVSQALKSIHSICITLSDYFVFLSLKDKNNNNNKNSVTVNLLAYVFEPCFSETEICVFLICHKL